MATNDDYLWDRSGAPDPEVERLEQMLGALRSMPPAPGLSRLLPRETPYIGARFFAPALAAAAAVVLMVGVAWRTTQTPVSWPVASLSGAPRIGSARLSGDGRLAVGDTLVTDAGSTARLEVAAIGEVTIAGNSRVRLLETRDSHYRLALDRGSLHAIISAPPGQFVVDTPSARATDLGCVYTLRVDEDGSGLLSVAAGWVAFEEKGRESFVPAGATSRLDPVRGPGTPIYDDADPAFDEAIAAIDGSAGDLTETPRRHDAVQTALAHARRRDAMTLWHLIPRVPPAERGAVVDALSRHVAMPSTVTRDAVMQLDRAALDRWWNALDLLDTTWWRQWKRPLPDVAPR